MSITSREDRELCYDALGRAADKLEDEYGRPMNPTFEHGFHAALEIERSRGMELRFKAHEKLCEEVDAAVLEADRAGVDAAAICGLLMMKVRMIQDEAMEYAKKE